MGLVPSACAHAVRESRVITPSAIPSHGRLLIADVGELEKPLLQSHVTFTPTPGLSRHFWC